MKKVHLSTYISITITLLVIISTLVISGILYFNLSKILTSEFEGRVKAECGEIMQVLVNQFPQTGTRLTKPGLDDTIRDTIMPGATQKLQEYFSKNKNSTILVIKENQAWDLMSGKSIKGFSALSEKIKKEDLSYCMLNGKKTIVVKKIEMPDLIYISNLDRLDKTKKRVLALILYSSLAVLIFTIVLSIFFSRLLMLPLSQLLKQSLDMACGKLDPERKISSNVIEVEQLMTSLSAMVISLKKTEELKRYQQLFEGVTDPVFINAFSTNFIEVNQIALDQFGLKKEAFDTMRLIDIVPEKHRKRILKAIQDLSQKGGSVVFETEIFTKTDRLVYVECHSRKIVFREQEVILSVIRDITDRKRVEEALMKSEERLSMALEVSLAGAWELNVKTGEFTIDVNQFKSFGYSEIDHPRKVADLLKIVDPESIERVKNYFNNFIQGKCLNYTDEFLVRTKTGEKRWMHNRARVIKLDNDQKPMVVIGTLIEISELKRAEQTLKENEERYRTILDNRNIGYFEIDLHGDLIFFNDNLSNLMGYSHDELLGLNYRAYTDKATSVEIENKYKNIFKTGRPLEKLEYAIIVKDGGVRMVEASVSLKKDSRGKAIGFRGLAMDITDRKIAEQDNKNLETKLIQAQKMEAIGTLAGGIAHDFNNILSGIFGYSQLAEMNIENPVKIKAHIGQIVKGAQRAAGLIQQILAFSRQTEHEKQLLNISNVVKETLKLLRSSIPSTIEIRENIFSDATVLADPTQIHQVVMNLCTNAYHAMRTTGGILTVELKEIEILDQNNIPDLNILPGKYLKLSVSDTGHGMDEEILRKIFDPYFTTKEVGEGTGLGLALVYGIVEASGGYVKVDSFPGEGSIFHIFFPITDKKNKISKVKTNNSKPLTGGTERIMIVDDEESILFSSLELLQDYGYKVRAFSNGANAFKAFEKNPYQFDLILTDMTMPKMTGDELSSRVLEIRKDLPIILCTGYSDNINETKALKLGIKGYLQKPVETQRLLILIRDVLDGK